MKMRRFFRAVVLLSSVSLAFAGPKIAKDLPLANPGATVDVIVQFRQAPGKP